MRGPPRVVYRRALSIPVFSFQAQGDLPRDADPMYTDRGEQEQARHEQCKTQQTTESADPTGQGSVLQAKMRHAGMLTRPRRILQSYPLLCRALHLEPSGWRRRP